MASLALAASAGPLEIGRARPLHVRVERVSTHAHPCRLLYASDVHLRPGRSGAIASDVLDAVTLAAPDAVLLGGDLVDNRSELDALRDLVASARRLAPVLAVGGNHDDRVGHALVRDAVERGGGRWIHHDVARLTHRDRTIAIAGPGASPAGGGDVRVLCAHDPRIWTTARHAGYDVVFAGHLHGCQLVTWESRGRLFPGALLYPHCCLIHRHESSTLVVSRGVSDLLQVRWRCPREVVVCHV